VCVGSTGLCQVVLTLVGLGNDEATSGHGTSLSAGPSDPRRRGDVETVTGGPRGVCIPPGMVTVRLIRAPPPSS